MPTPNCQTCRGACCETILLSRQVAGNFDPEWLAVRAHILPGGMAELECRCPKLGPDGLCTIYDTRPEVCRDFEEGGVPCLFAVYRRRPWM